MRAVFIGRHSRTITGMELPDQMFVKPVDGQSDLFAFRYDFAVEPEGKAGEIQVDTVTEAEDGDLIIQGYAAVFDGVDRQGENFTEGAFKRGIKSFLSNGGPLNFHHKHDHGIGKVLHLEEEEGKGLKIRARVDFQPESSPLRYIYNAIKKGTYRGLSVGGFFKRQLTKAGYRIADMDFTEISVTPVPVHPGTNFAVVAGKALADLDTAPVEPEEVEDNEPSEAELTALGERVTALGDVFDRIKAAREGGEVTVTT